MHTELQEFESYVTALEKEAKQGDVIRYLATGGVGLTLLTGATANPIGLLGLGGCVAAHIWQCIEESQVTGCLPRWIPSFNGYGHQWLIGALRHDYRKQAIALLYAELGKGVVQSFVNRSPDSDAALSLLIHERSEMEAMLDDCDTPEDEERVRIAGLDALRKIVGLDAVATPPQQVAPAVVPTSPAGTSQATAVDLFDWARLQQDPNVFPHLLILGKTGAGKSTLAERLLHLLSGDAMILTPHYKPSDFPGYDVIGKGRVYGDIAKVLDAVLDEMDGRYQLYAIGDENYPWLNICIDEFPSITANCPNAAGVVKTLAREARKVKIRLIILSQGGEVKTLGIEGEGSIRENFTMIRLKGFAEAYAKKIGVDVSGYRFPCLVEDAIADTSQLVRMAPSKKPVNQWHNGSQASPVDAEWVEDGEWEMPIQYLLTPFQMSPAAIRLHSWMVSKLTRFPNGFTLRDLQTGKALGKNAVNSAETLQPPIAELIREGKATYSGNAIYPIV